MNSDGKPDGQQQKRLLVNTISETVAGLTGGEPDELTIEAAGVAALAYHYSVGVLGSREIASRVKVDPAFAIWRKRGGLTPEQLQNCRAERKALLRQCLIDALSWSWNVSLRSQVTGVGTQAYADKIVAGRPPEHQSAPEVAAEADRRISSAISQDTVESS